MRKLCETPKISCPLFIKQDKIITDITNKINKAGKSSEKAKLAEELKDEINVLLKCEDYDDDSLNCERCQLFVELCNTVKARPVE